MRLMLPAWATVVLALGGAAIGALAGLTGAALQRRTAKDQLTHEETGPRSAAKAAEEVDEKIWELKKEVHRTRIPWNTGTKRKIANLLDATNKAHVEFVRRAHVACQPERWNEPEQNG